MSHIRIDIDTPQNPIEVLQNLFKIWGLESEIEVKAEKTRHPRCYSSTDKFLFAVFYHPDAKTYEESVDVSPKMMVSLRSRAATLEKGTQYALEYVVEWLKQSHEDAVFTYADGSIIAIRRDGQLILNSEPHAFRGWVGWQSPGYLDLITIPYEFEVLPHF